MRPPMKPPRSTGAACRRSADMQPLPDGAEPLTRFVDAPPALARRLSHIGIVSRTLGQALAERIEARPAPRQPSKAMSGAGTASPPPPMRRVPRQSGLPSAIAWSRSKPRRRKHKPRMEQRARRFRNARGAAESALRAERERREAWRAAASAVEVARRALSQHERQVAERLQQTGALDEAKRRVEAEPRRSAGAPRRGRDRTRRTAGARRAHAGDRGLARPRSIASAPSMPKRAPVMTASSAKPRTAPSG